MPTNNQFITPNVIIGTPHQDVNIWNVANLYTQATNTVLKKNSTLAKVPEDKYDLRIRDLWNLGPVQKLNNKFLDSFIKAQPISYINEYNIPDRKSLVGLEIEVENVMHVDHNISLGFWEITTDGSLRNNGREFRTIGAIPLSYAEYALVHLFTGLNPDIDFSVRTSIHVHQDVRGMTFEQVICLLLLYLVVENLLFKYAGNNRRNSIYCVPIIETDVLSSFSGKEDLFRLFESPKNHWMKYTAFNILPTVQLGSVEYRHMPGTANVRKLMIWLDLLSALKIYAYKHTYFDLVETISQLNTNSGYLKFVESIFGDRAIYLDTKDLLNDMEHAVYIVKNCALGNTFHQHVIKTNTPDSMISKLWTNWKTQLRPSQLEALTQFCAKLSVREDQMENLYKEMRANPQLYLDNWPSLAKLVKCVALLD